MVRGSVVSLIAGRELHDRLRRPSYYVIAGLFMVVILAAGIGARLAGSHGPGRIDVTVAGSQAPAVATELRSISKAAGRTVQVVVAPSLGEALTRFDDGNAELVVDTDHRRIIATGEQSDMTDSALVRQAWTTAQLRSNLVAAGLDEGAAAQALQVAPLSLDTRTRPGSTDTGAIVTGTLAAALLFVSLQIFGGQILSGVVEEKSGAVVEVLLARMGADELLAGKVLGVGAAAMIQFGVLVLTALVALGIAGTAVPGAIWTAVPMALVWYLAGFSFYAMLFALAGSLVSRQEDAAGAAAPVTTALIGAYALLFIVARNPDSAAATVLSLLPPFAPILMPLRMASGSAGPLEVVTALVLLVAGVVAAWRITARVYAQVLLTRGSRISWSRAWAIARGHPT